MSFFAKHFSLFCECGSWVGMFETRTMCVEEALRLQWKRVRGRGWLCPGCVLEIKSKTD